MKSDDTVKSDMHILIIPSWYPATHDPVNGVYFQEQAHALQAAGHRVGVIAPLLRPMQRLREKVFGWPRGVAYEDDDGIATYRHYAWAWLPGVPFGNARSWLKAAECLFNVYVAEHGNPDIVHAHAALYAGVAATQLKKRCGIPVVLTEHSTAFARGVLQPWQRNVIRKAFQEADVRISVSPNLGKVLEEQYGTAFRPWHWVPNIVDQRFFKVETRPHTQLAQRRFRFLNVAMLVAKKGHKDLLKAFANQFRGNLEVELRIASDGPLRRELETMASELGIREQVIFLGKIGRAQVCEEMHLADAFVLTSHYETFGVVVIEALATGTPVVSTNSGGPESILTEDDGILVPVQDVGRLGLAMRAMYENIGQYDSSAIQARCVARFGGSVVAEQLSAIYEKVLADKRAMPAEALADEH